MSKLKVDSKYSYTGKKIERISKKQKQKLVEYMSTNLEFARGQFKGINSNCNYKEQWEALKTSLNSLGGSEKTVEQWKKCWIDLKCGVKKTVNSKQCMNQTGEASWADVSRDLNPLEEKIFQIINMDSVYGDACTPESDVLEEPFEEFLSVDAEEIYSVSPAKKLKITNPISIPSTSKAAQNKCKELPSASANAPKYKEALYEAREMQKELMTKLNNLEEQNAIILKKLSKIEIILGE